MKTRVTPAICTGANDSPRKSAPLARPEPGISNANGEISAVGYRCNNAFHEPNPKSVAPYDMTSTQPHASGLIAAMIRGVSAPPSNAKASASSGSGGTRLDQTVNANM